MNESVDRLSETKFYMTQNLYPPKLKSVDNRFYITKYRDSVNCSAFYYTNIKIFETAEPQVIWKIR